MGIRKSYNILKSNYCLLDETMSGEAMAFNVINKINNKLKFFHHKNDFLRPALRRMLCNV